MKEATTGSLAAAGPGGTPDSRLFKTTCLYAGVPCVVVLYATANNWKLLESAGLGATLGYYLIHALGTWPVTAVVTWLVWRGLAPLRPGLFPITVIGSLLGCLATIPYMDLIVNSLPQAGELATATHGRDWSRLANSTLRATVIWVGINWLFDRHFGLPRYRYGEQRLPHVTRPMGDVPTDTAPPVSTDPALGTPGDAPLPAFMRRLSRPACVESLVAIRAEQHYIMVIMDTWQELVLYRLGDAVSELPANSGVQVHRSWWVKGSAIRSAARGQKKMSLTLRNGLEVPVSAPYQALVRTLLERQAPQAVDKP